MKSGITLHRLTPANAQTLLDADVFDHPVDPAQLAAFVTDAGHELIFATLGGDVVGMASGVVLLHPDKQPAFFVNEIGVRKNMRLRGIATALLSELLDLARRRGCHGIWLGTEVGNAAACALYRKLGARETEGIVVYDWDGAMDE